MPLRVFLFFPPDAPEEAANHTLICRTIQARCLSSPAAPAGKTLVVAQASQVVHSCRPASASSSAECGKQRKAHGPDPALQGGHEKEEEEEEEEEKKIRRR